MHRKPPNFYYKGIITVNFLNPSRQTLIPVNYVHDYTISPCPRCHDELGHITVTINYIQRKVAPVELYACTECGHHWWNYKK